MSTTIFKNAKTEQALAEKLALVMFGGKPPLAPRPPKLPSLPANVAEIAPSRVVLGFDATGSRQDTWSMSSELTDALLAAMPGGIEVALAVHGGEELHTFTDFERDPTVLRQAASGVSCRGGMTRMLPLIERTLEAGNVSTLVYIGDAFEENHQQGVKLAVALAHAHTRLIILQDRAQLGRIPVWEQMAALTGGCALPFDAMALSRMQDLLAAVSVLAIGGREMLVDRQKALPGARILLNHIKS